MYTRTVRSGTIGGQQSADRKPPQDHGIRVGSNLYRRKLRYGLHHRQQPAVASCNQQKTAGHRQN